MSTRGDSETSSISMPELPDWLLPFQAEDVRRLYKQPSVLNANQMGTGKTYEAIAMDLVRRQLPELEDYELKTLVIAPLSTLHRPWVEKWNELAPGLKVIVVDPKKRGVFVQELKTGDFDVAVVHWDVLRILTDNKGTGPLQQYDWFHIIADEAHRAKNRKAQQTRALKRLKALYKTALTGTPVMNYPQDIWSILNWLYKSRYSSYWRFYEHFVDFEIEYPHGYHKIRGPKNVAELRAQIEPWFVQRTKEEVLPDLPEKYYTTIEVELHPKQRAAYNQMKKEMIAWLETQDGTKPLAAPVVIAQLVRLQQLAIAYADVTYSSEMSEGSSGVTVSLTDPSAKLDALFELLEDENLGLSNGNDDDTQSVVIFSQFRRAIGLVEARLNARGSKYVRITGDDSEQDRRRAVDDFQKGRARIFLGTIGAGSEGITLTRASTVIFLDRDWTPARNAQAEDRLHRIGQDSAVQVIDIVARNTIDSYRFAKLEMKKRWIREMLEDEL